jgi:uncharacterized OsmC-like protein
MNAITTTPSTVNGIPVDAVRGLIDAVAAQPAAGATRWRVTNHWCGRMRSRATVEGFRIGGQRVSRAFQMYADEPLELGGTNMDANPQEYLLAGLNACMIVGFTALCALEGYEIEHLEIATEGDIDLRGFLGLDAAVSPGYDRLTTTLWVKGAASPEQFQQIFEAMLVTSPNVHNLTKPIQVTPNLVVL